MAEPTKKLNPLIRDARGRQVRQFDPVAAHLLRQTDMIPADDLRTIALAVDAKEVKTRYRTVWRAPLQVAVYFTGFAGYFWLFNRWRGWDPVLIGLAVLYVTFPFVAVYYGFRKARAARWERIRSIMLEHLHCPHCAYDIRGLPVNGKDGATVCPECGCAWMLGNAEDG